VSDAVCQVRPAGAGDAEAVADLAAGLAQSFPFSRARFDLSYPALLADGDACLLLAVDGEERLGYLLGFRHLTFYANGPLRGPRAGSAASKMPLWSAMPTRRASSPW
jgi:hypothetical protein